MLRLFQQPLLRLFFQRVSFAECKGWGANLHKSAQQDVLFDRCALKYANLDGSRLRALRFQGCDMEGLSLSECKLSGLELADCRLVGTSFYKTALTGVD